MFTGERIARLAQQAVEQKLTQDQLVKVAKLLPIFVSSIFILELKLKHGIDVLI